MQLSTSFISALMFGVVSSTKGGDGTTGGVRIPKYPDLSSLLTYTDKVIRDPANSNSIANGFQYGNWKLALGYIRAPLPDKSQRDDGVGWQLSRMPPPNSGGLFHRVTVDPAELTRHEEYMAPKSAQLPANDDELEKQLRKYKRYRKWSREKLLSFIFVHPTKGTYISFRILYENGDFVQGSGQLGLRVEPDVEGPGLTWEECAKQANGYWPNYLGRESTWRLAMLPNMRELEPPPPILPDGVTYGKDAAGTRFE